MVLLYVVEFIRIIMTITRPVTNVLLNIIYSIILGRTEPLPPIDTEILLMSATELAVHIRKRKISAEDVMQTYINRAKDVNRIINAYVDERFEEALADARNVDHMIDEGTMTEHELATKWPLLGVPFSCKEMVGVKGMAHTNGLLFFKDRKAPSDAAVVTKYKEAGGIPYVVTNVPTLSMAWETSNLVFGRTLNPFDKRRTPGGSSGGEAALITSAGAVIGIGTDIGGSIRVPSAFCGIYGHKPSRGFISNEQPWPDRNPNLEDFRSTGPICRYVQDLKMLLRISCGDDIVKLNLDKKVDFTEMEIFYMEELPGISHSATQDVKAAVRKAVDHFQLKFGRHPTKLILNEMKYSSDICQCKFIEKEGPPVKCMQKSVKTNWYWELLKSFFGRSWFDLQINFFAITEKSSKDKQYYKFLEMFETLKNKMEDTLKGDAILIMPTHPEPAPHIYTPIIKFKNIGYTCMFNCLGYPATNIPADMSCGMPIGLQIVSARNNDRLTLAAAEELDKIFFGWKSPCEISVKN